MSRDRCQGRVTREASFGKEILRAAAGLLLALLLIPVGALAEDEPAPLEAAPEQAEAPSAPVVDPDLVVEEAPDAETETPEHGGIEEILVTAQKRSSNLQETPTAITALSGAQLFDRGIYDIESLATQVPNFQYGETFGIARITIRGIGNQGFTDPSTAFHINGIYQNNPTAASALTFYDIAQIEVLRGPQGTLWGRNSTAGAINVTTRAPVHEFEIFGDLLRGSYEQWFGRGVVNVPVIEDRIAARAAFFFDKRDGYQENLAYPGTTSQNADDADTWGIRPQLLFDITDEISLTMRGGYSHQGGVGWASKIQGNYPGPYPFGGPLAVPAAPSVGIPVDSFAYTFVDPYMARPGVIPPEAPVPPNPEDPRQIWRDARQFQDIDSWDVNGTLVWDFYVPGIGDMSFSVVGSYRDEVRAQNFDVDLTSRDMIVSNVTASTRDRVIDAHLRSEGDTSTEWLLGFFMLDADGQLDIDLPGGGGSSNIFYGAGGRVCIVPQTSPVPPPTCPQSGFVLLGNQLNLYGARVGGSNDTLSLAGYGHLRHKFYDDKLRIGLGLRYSWDRSRATRYSDEVTALAPGTLTANPNYPPPPLFVPLFTPGNNCIQPGFDTKGEASWDSVTGDLKIEFLPVEDHMVYVSVSRGYKPGYINGQAVALGCDPPPPPAMNPYDLGNALEEAVWAYEIGSKNRFLDNTLQANLTGFVYQYDNLQVQDVSDSTTFIQNAARAQVRGIEFEGIWEPIEYLSLSVVYGYLNARYLDYIGFDFATGSQDQNFSGNHMIRAPEHTATLAAEYMWDLGDRGSIIPRIQYFVSDEIFFNASNRPEDTEPAYGTLQLRGRWESSDENLFIEGFVENVTDEDVRSTRAIGSGLLGRPVTVAYEPPRTWGVRIGGSY